MTVYRVTLYFLQCSGRILRFGEDTCVCSEWTVEQVVYVDSESAAIGLCRGFMRRYRHLYCRANCSTLS